MQALTHLGSAMVDLHTAIQIHVHQSPGLVEECGGKTDTKFHGRDREAAFQNGAVGVPNGDGLGALAIVRCTLQCAEQGGQDIVFHLHLVMRGVASGRFRIAGFFAF